jgi:hypothetical protein
MSHELSFESEIPRQRRKWHPLGMSLMTHTLLALFLLLCGFFSQGVGRQQSEVRRAGIVLAVASESEPKYLSETSELNELDQESTPAAVAEANSAAPPAIELEATKMLDTTGLISAESMVFDANRMSVVPEASGSKAEFQLSEEDLKMIEADRKLLKSRQPKGNATSISVFGSGNLTGRDFVFVLDRSNSMGSSGLGVIQASRKELSAAIAQLEPNHQFQIVAYHHGTSTMNGRRMLAANEQNKAGVADFIAGLASYGGTAHENGLIAAIAFRPDVIVLLTDGGLPGLNDGQLQMLKQLTDSKTQIHCVQFGSGPLQKSNNFMMRLAAQNNGGYKYVDVNQWEKMP